MQEKGEFRQRKGKEELKGEGEERRKDSIPASTRRGLPHSCCPARSPDTLEGVGCVYCSPTLQVRKPGAQPKSLDPGVNPTKQQSWI